MVQCNTIVIYHTNSMKRVKNTVISTDEKKKKAFDSTHTFMIKIFNKLEGNFLNIIKGIYEKPTGNIIFKGERLRVSS